MTWVYILRCSDDSFYVGSAQDLEQRVEQHTLGAVDAYTRSRRPVNVVWAQACDNIGEAFALEHKLKGWRRDKKLALIEGRYGDLRALSRSGPHPPRPTSAG